jgi:hypothetical protein
MSTASEWPPGNESARERNGGEGRVSLCGTEGDGLATVLRRRFDCRTFGLVALDAATWAANSGL